MNEVVQEDSIQWDWTLAPGQIVLDSMRDHSLTRAKLASALELNRTGLNCILSGSSPITREIAERLSSELGNSCEFWMNLENNYRRDRERLADTLIPHLDELKRIQYRELMNRGWIVDRRASSRKNKKEILFDCLMFLNIPNIDAWHEETNDNSLFRLARSGNSNAIAIKTWMQICDFKVTIPKPEYDKQKFLETLPRLRALTTEAPKDFYRQIKKLLNKCGIGYICQKSIQGASIGGATRLIDGHPVIYQSLYGKYNDIYWFTFFHECAHVLLGHLDDEEIFIDLSGPRERSDPEEEEADKWAQDFLIPSARRSEMETLRTPAQITEFAEDLGIHPAIVVGRLKHENLLDHSVFNDRRVRFRIVPQNRS